VQDLTLGCNKVHGSADGYFFHGDTIVCASS